MSAPKKPAKNQAPIFGRWQAIRPIGQGGFGLTIEVKHLDTEKFAIVKLINSNHYGDDYDDYVRRFKREMRILSELQHPNICKLYEANFDANPPWFAMERYKGNTVSEELEQYGPAPEKIWFDRARDILSALEYAHSKKIMHGDLNPGNVIIDGRGAKLIDFGIARKADNHSSNSTTIFGANGWTAPEHGTLPPGVENDIFVAASLLVLLGTGHSAFKGNRVNNYHDSIRVDDPDYSGLSTNQQLLLKSMHRKDRAKRTTAAQALAEIERLQPSGAVRNVVGAPKVGRPVQVIKKAPAAVAKVQATAQNALGSPVIEAGKAVANHVPKETIKRKGLVISAIASGGVTLLSYWFISKLKRTRDLDYKLKFPLSITALAHIASFGITSPIATIWWCRKIGFKGFKTLLVAQSFFGLLAFMGTVAEANQSPSGFLTTVRVIGLILGVYGFRRILDVISPKPEEAIETPQGAQAGKIGSKVEIREGLVDSMLVGTHTSWPEVEAFFAKVLSKKEGKRFIFEIESDVYTDIYFQGYSEPDDSRTIEAAADLSVRPHLTSQQKSNMAAVGWDLPSEGLPNFIMFLEVRESDSRSLASIFTRSLKDGYGLEIGTFRVLAPVR